ncbi:AfsR/SARP family transcriptional regulator [Planosporangium thailandense]|uniref:AfsR/SARP family transcriptional regulator n=2 Tax=Planosporangium thailandense TaxID=765197 RepID=A0ABX0Y3D0_9ACTN|nr:AfsR/SARP family transcriptional regulator [Planosporangium thailandense]
MAILALYANRTVRTDTIIDMIWGCSPPPAARNQVQVQVSHIRKTLRTAGAADVVETQPDGYLLRLEPAACDFTVFTALESVGEMARKEHRYRAASEAFRLALRAWSGPALAERRLAVFQRWVDLEIGLDRHARLLPELFQAVRAEPLDEDLCLRLMACLQRSGRIADALKTYRRTRQTLRRELGIDPHPTLQSAEAAILRGDLIEHPNWSFLELEPSLLS